MKRLNRQNKETNLYPIRIIQYGEGNFLRGFSDWMIYKMNNLVGFNTGIAIIQPRPNGKIGRIKEQDGLYSLTLKGLENGKPQQKTEIINVISQTIDPYEQYEEYLKLAENPDLRFVFSNTTEAGIRFSANDQCNDRPALSFPGKLAQLLYHRFRHFKGSENKGLIFFPSELIENNGEELKRIILQYARLWELETFFSRWIENCNFFANTLVDRIVPGYPAENIDLIQERIGYEDRIAVEGESFHSWIIEAPQEIAKEFPAMEASLHVLFVDDLKPYRERKVTLLNGPHTLLSPVAYLSGLKTVQAAVEDSVVGMYIRKAIFEELIPTLDLQEEESKEFANQVIARFQNPFIRHEVINIMLNSFSKYKTRNLPALLRYLERKGSLPDCLVFGLAAIITFYKGICLNNETIKPQDDEETLSLFSRLWKENKIESIAESVLKESRIWDKNLNDIPGLTQKLTEYLIRIDKGGMTDAVKSIL